MRYSARFEDSESYMDALDDAVDDIDWLVAGINAIFDVSLSDTSEDVRNLIDKAAYIANVLEDKYAMKDEE